MLLLGFWRPLWHVGHILASFIIDIAPLRKIGANDMRKGENVNGIFYRFLSLPVILSGSVITFWMVIALCSTDNSIMKLCHVGHMCRPCTCVFCFEFVMCCVSCLCQHNALQNSNTPNPSHTHTQKKRKEEKKGKKH